MAQRMIASLIGWIATALLPALGIVLFVRLGNEVFTTTVLVVAAHVLLALSTLAMQAWWLRVASVSTWRWVAWSAIGLLCGGIVGMFVLSVAEAIVPEYVGTLVAMGIMGLGLAIPQQRRLRVVGIHNPWITLTVVGWISGGIIWRVIPFLEQTAPSGHNELSLLSTGFVMAALYTAPVLPRRTYHRRAVLLILAAVGALLLSVVFAARASSVAERPIEPGECDSALQLPAGFCATVFADSVGVARHLVVAPNGDVFVALWDGHAKGGVIALRDTNHDGRADVRVKFGNDGGSGLALHDTSLYRATWTSVLRYTLDARSFVSANVDTIVRGLPKSGHAARSIVVTRSGELLVNIGAPTNACQKQDRVRESVGEDPCTLREHFAGIWRFDARRRGQVQSDGVQMVKGLRHAVAFTEDRASRTLYAVQHGRDELAENWPRLFTAQQGATLPAEELLRIEPGKDYGWPYCYYDGIRHRRVLAPEYGGDGEREGRCAGLPAPLKAFPAHWAPNGMLFYHGHQFPARYAGGVFVAFHGGWYRPPPDNGFNVVFVPKDSLSADTFEIFADGFAGSRKRPANAAHRPVGLAEDSSGALLISDDAGGRIWRVVYRPLR